MTTGNLRTAAQAPYKSTVEHDLNAAIQARTFGSVIAGLSGGALVGAHMTLRLGARAGWIAAAVLGGALALFVAAIATPSGPLALGDEVREALRRDLPEGAVQSAAPHGDAQPLDKARLEELLGRFQGRVAEMARHMGITRPKLYRLLWAEGLDPAQFRGH